MSLITRAGDAVLVLPGGWDGGGGGKGETARVHLSPAV